MDKGWRKPKAGTLKRDTTANFKFGRVLMMVLGKPGVKNKRNIVRKSKYRWFELLTDADEATIKIPCCRRP